MTLPPDASVLDEKIATLARRYRGLAARILKEAIRVPADHIADDPACGRSNHERPRLEGLRQAIIDEGAVERAEDVFFDAFGNLRWSVRDRYDGVPDADKKVILLEGHTDTVDALRAQWTEKIGSGLDAYDGLTDADAVDEAYLRSELGSLPPRKQWSHLVFGRGSADQLSGVVAQIIATKILLELRADGALFGAHVHAMGTVAEEDNDGGGPMYLVHQEWTKADAVLPDVVILTEGTGDATKGSLGIYRGQRGRMQIEVEVTGRSCHGSMPWEGKNPLEYGAAMIVEARDAYNNGIGFADHAFLGAGSRTASWAKLDTPSDCAVPERFTFRFDRRLTVGETPAQALEDINTLAAVIRARDAGLSVDVRIPHYDRETWRGYRPDNAQIYPGWETPADHPVIAAAERSYRAVVSPHLNESPGVSIPTEPRIDRWIFSTDGVGYPVSADGTDIVVPAAKQWVTAGELMHPPMFGIGPGVEQNTHKVGEFVDLRELQHAAAVMARFVAFFVEGEAVT